MLDFKFTLSRSLPAPQSAGRLISQRPACDRRYVMTNRTLRGVGPAGSSGRRMHLALGGMLLVAALSQAQGAAFPPDYITRAIADTARPAEQIELDVWRKPAAVIAFSGLKPGDRVADFMPGNAYFTRMFSKIVGPKGHVYAFVPAQELANCSP